MYFVRGAKILRTPSEIKQEKRIQVFSLEVADILRNTNYKSGKLCIGPGTLSMNVKNMMKLVSGVPEGL